jgi:hypothetical protein
MCGRTRRQHHGTVARLGELRRELARGLAVEADSFQPWAQVAQAREIVGGAVADLTSISQYRALNRRQHQARERRRDSWPKKTLMQDACTT